MACCWTRPLCWSGRKSTGSTGGGRHWWPGWLPWTGRCPGPRGGGTVGERGKQYNILSNTITWYQRKKWNLIFHGYDTLTKFKLDEFVHKKITIANYLQIKAEYTHLVKVVLDTPMLWRTIYRYNQIKSSVISWIVSFPNLSLNSIAQWVKGFSTNL